MSPDQVQLLKALGSGVRPIDLGERATEVADRFRDLLDGALQGRARTDLGVSFAPSISGTFDSVQRDQIARAVDVAAAAGSEHALILHGTQTLRVDVRNRVVLDAPELQPLEAVTGIDSFVGSQTMSSQEDDAFVGGVPQGGITPARVVRNASLVRALSQPTPTHDM
jgi:hypothetical protein